MPTKLPESGVQVCWPCVISPLAPALEPVTGEAEASENHEALPPIVGGDASAREVICRPAGPTIKPAYQGVIIQKGTRKGGSGYFMSRATPVTGLGESGRVQVQAK